MLHGIAKALGLPSLRINLIVHSLQVVLRGMWLYWDTITMPQFPCL